MDEKILQVPLRLPKKEVDGFEFWPSSILSKHKKQLFEQHTIYPAVIVPARETSKIRQSLKHILIKQNRLKDVYPLEQTDACPNDATPIHQQRKIVLLRLSNNNDDDVMEDDVFQDTTLQRWLSSSESCKIRKSSHSMKKEYKDWTVDQVLRFLLPPVDEIPSSFETAGHVAHVNLKDTLLPFKFIIGQVILDKNPSALKTVVNKTGNIHNTYRTFSMEYIATSDDPLKLGTICQSLPITLKEEGHSFTLDFCKVYWNSRLQHEHKRIVNLIARSAASKSNTTQPLIVADACAGVGPFAIPLSKRNNHPIRIHANDLNPDSFHYLNQNAKLNSSPPSVLKTYNMDGQQFVLHLQQTLGIFPQHYIFNLPASAPELLTVFRGYKHPNSNTISPYIHVHCFAPKTEKDQAHKPSIERCERSLGCKIEPNETKVHIVRDVSPKNNMICITFQLPPAIQNVTPIISLKNKHTKTEGELSKIEKEENVMSLMENQNLTPQPNLKKQRLD